jgi:hypothetical protein
MYTFYRTKNGSEGNLDWALVSLLTVDIDLAEKLAAKGPKI